ncbi:MAG: DUF3137 domain-containing protein [Caulobacteraceae bacterium]
MTDTPITLDASGLDALYASDIEPKLIAFEGERKKAMGQFWLRIGIGAPAALIIGGTIGAVWDGGWGLGIGFVVLVFASIWAYGPLDAVAKKAKIAVLQAIATALKVNYTLNGFTPPAFPHFGQLHLLPGHDRSSVEDLFDGVRSDCPFALYDAHLESRSRDSKGRETWTTVFRGCLIRIGFPKQFLGTTIVRRDAGIFNMFRENKELKRVGLGDSRFEKIFEVYGSDQVEARFLVHPVFMEKLLALETTFKGGKIRCGFDQGDLLIAVEGRDHFEIGGMFSSLVEKTRVTRMATDVTTVMGLIDTVLAGPPPAYAAEIKAAQEAAAGASNAPIVS